MFRSDTGSSPTSARPMTLMHQFAHCVWGWQSLLSFKPEDSDFDHLDKIGPCYKGVKDKNKTYHGTLCHWVKVIHKKQKIWNWKFLQMKIWWFSSKYQGQEKLLALTCPLPQRVPMDNFGTK